MLPTATKTDLCSIYDRHKMYKCYPRQNKMIDNNSVITMINQCVECKCVKSLQFFFHNVKSERTPTLF